ncbi:MAG: hypothetical protein IJ766_03730 [Clostridia bacterium]|nr:hypothetical protein [Clostridia bacterium]
MVLIVKLIVKFMKVLITATKFGQLSALVAFFNDSDASEDDAAEEAEVEA